VREEWPPVAIECLSFERIEDGHRLLAAPLFVKDLSVDDLSLPGRNDERLPALGGRTPREAVRDADGCEAVQALLRQFERNMAREDPVLNTDIIDGLRATL